VSKSWPLAAFSKEDLETVSCPLCGNMSGNLLYDFVPFRVVRCNECDLGYLSPRLKSEVAKTFYQEEYFSSNDGQSCGYADYIKLAPAIKRTIMRRYRWIKPLVTGENVLDIGCAFGYSLDVLKGEFKNRFGLDLSSDAISEVVRKGHQGYCGDILSCPWENETFDLILCFDTIEHVYEPVPFMKKIANLLRPGGVTAIATPDIDSWLRRLSGKGWVSFKIPEHAIYFNRSSMIKLLNAAGLSVVFFRPDFQLSPADLVLQRLGKALPFFSWIFNSLERCKLSSKITLFVPNGMFLVVARKIPPQNGEGT